MVPTTSWDETSPSGSQSVSLGDDRIRELKTQIREVIDVDHDFPSSGQATDIGQHKRCTFQEQVDLGTGAVGTTILGSQTVGSKGELCYTDEDDNTIQFSNQGTPLLLTALTAKTTPVVADLLALCDTADSNKTKKITFANLLNFIYPVGYVITLGVSTNPGTLLGIGTWTAVAGRVIVGIDSGQTEFDTLDETGGAKTHTLNITEIPAHTHTYDKTSAGAGSSPGSGETQSYTSTASGSSGGGGAHNNLQPYIVKYVWQRTA